MRGKDTIALVYAQALLELAFEKGIHAEVLADLFEVQRALADDPRALAFFVAPHIRGEAKKQAVDRAFGGRVAQVLTDFLKVVIDKGRQASLPAIIDRFEELYHERMGETVVSVRSAVPLDEPARARLKEALKRRLEREPLLEETVDAALLGGLVIRTGDSVVDGSLRHRLASIAERLDATRVGNQMFVDG